ncbi:MAG: hypothetical protein JWO44_1229 [Bacteroidetes bacterium]|jgi:hypothetical protein|nr:hypothetical protein [Bacteroidota bacterium]
MLRNKKAMKEQVLIHEIKSSPDSQNNAKALLSPDGKGFYWDDKKFNYVNAGDYVFIVNPAGRWAYFTRVAQKNIHAGYDQKKRRSVFTHKNVGYTVEDPDGRFHVFVYFEIIERQELPEGWNWKDPLRSSEQLYLWAFDIAEPGKRLSRIQDLKKVFTKKRPAELLQKVEGLLKNIPLTNKQAMTVKQMSPGEIVKHVHAYMSSGGFQYQEEEIANFYLALKTKPFVILAGISGTGKTQLPRKFAAAIGMDDSQVIQVPVRPDWTDGSDLLGYTSLDGKFIPKDLTVAIKKAKENSDKPYFFILDEMNLARVEHYFSDFLSVIETREWDKNKKIKTDAVLRKESLQNASNAAAFDNYQWPQNLYLVGTVNMDETTHTFSRKVLDRANSIEMNNVDLNWSGGSGPKVEGLKGITNELFVTEFIGAKDLSEKEKESVADELKLLIGVNKILEMAGLHFAYRVRDEVAFYLVLNKKYGIMKDIAAMDFQLVQKVLPRIHGSSERVQVLLVELLNLLEKTSFKSTGFEYEQYKDKIEHMDFTYKRSSSKIVFMLKRFEDDRFTSFWL